jgi:hypothetical protein
MSVSERELIYRQRNNSYIEARPNAEVNIKKLAEFKSWK